MSERAHALGEGCMFPLLSLFFPSQMDCKLSEEPVGRDSLGLGGGGIWWVSLQGQWGEERKDEGMSGCGHQGWGRRCFQILE